MKNDLLVVYNTFGLHDNSAHYIKCIQSILDSKTSYDYKIAWSSCFNSEKVRKRLMEVFKDKISLYSFIDKKLTVNITFNKTVRESVKQFGNFKYYLYLDSGVDFCGNETAINEGLDALHKNNYGMLSYQLNNDAPIKDAKATEFPIKGNDHIIPVGGGYNAHADIYSDELFTAFNMKLMPDVFVAFCTESVYSFLVAAIGKKWAIKSDIMLNHAKSVDGPSSMFPHISPKTNTPWNNLLCGRDALTFINDKEAIEAGLGYEECNTIMMHKQDAYTPDGMPLNKEALKKAILKYFFLTNEELDYDKI